ncbi:hypothetical protein ABZ649_04805 [Streptomyces albidoflavus]|uniref:hypothetical protein n=1 Tax=Streptomyces albidoflavus TaxID=1886 RepID=UPI0033C47147
MTIIDLAQAAQLANQRADMLPLRARRGDAATTALGLKTAARSLRSAAVHLRHGLPSVGRAVADIRAAAACLRADDGADTRDSARVTQFANALAAAGPAPATEADGVLTLWWVVLDESQTSPAIVSCHEAPSDDQAELLAAELMASCLAVHQVQADNAESAICQAYRQLTAK